MHDQTALKTEGIEDLLGQFPQVELSLDSGYQGLAKLDPKRIVVPPPKPGQPPLRTRSPTTSLRADISRPNVSASSTPSPR
ncbi:hypothetical protein [Streptomyces canus]|uniref:hypothetical protein n=1 Tax=Streptomyces canus TaxID=58343 RepID=UPI003F4C4D47